MDIEVDRVGAGRAPTRGYENLQTCFVPVRDPVAIVSLGFERGVSVDYVRFGEEGAVCEKLSP